MGFFSKFFGFNKKEEARQQRTPAKIINASDRERADRNEYRYDSTFFSSEMSSMENLPLEEQQEEPHDNTNEEYNDSLYGNENEVSDQSDSFNDNSSTYDSSSDSSSFDSSDFGSSDSSSSSD